MLTTMIAGAAMLLAPLFQDTDTTFAVPAGARVEVENFSGEVAVSAWDRNAVRVVARHSGRERVGIRTSGTVVRIESHGRMGPPRDVEIELTVPAASAIRVNGPFTDVSIAGAGGDVTVETVRGDIDVRGGNGRISLRSVEGEIRLEGSRGRIELGAVNEDIRVTGSAGDIRAEAVNGDVLMERIESANVAASTVNGDITYAGSIRDGGRYALATHNGEIELAVPERTNATVTISTFNGDVESDLPITLTETRRGRRFTFTVGNGSAQIDLESFNGTINLRRPGANPR